MEIDLNSDLGEGCAHDAEIIPLITSANVACGFHAGDPAIAMRTLQEAAKHGVQIGAHPSFPDRENFGRTEMQRSEQQIYEDCVYQVGAMIGLAKAAGLSVTYVKPHGALYNMACRDASYARPIVAAAALFKLGVMGLPSSKLQDECKENTPFIAEGFADRGYMPNGSLVPRSRPDAFVENPTQAAEQVDWLIRTRGVRTICVHGDNPRAVEFVRELRSTLLRQGFTIRAFA